MSAAAFVRVQSDEERAGGRKIFMKNSPLEGGAPV